MNRRTSRLRGRLWKLGWVSAVVFGAAVAAACANVWGFRELTELGDSAPPESGVDSPVTDGGGLDAPSTDGPRSNDAKSVEACAPQSFCGGECRDIASDPNHCGGCNACPFTGMICEDGGCVCEVGYHLCEAQGLCAMDSDPTLCGASCAVCPGAGSTRAQFGTVSCVNGACVLTCEYPSLTSCISGPNGDCFDLSSDPTHCGACNIDCSAPPSNGMATCSGTPPKCGVYCDPGYTPCDAGSPSCVYTMNDPSNCGSCGHVCPGADALCVNGLCQ